MPAHANPTTTAPTHVNGFNLNAAVAFVLRICCLIYYPSNCRLRHNEGRGTTKKQGEMQIMVLQNI
jgi:hypothetical protein